MMEMKNPSENDGEETPTEIEGERKNLLKKEGKNKKTYWQRNRVKENQLKKKERKKENLLKNTLLTKREKPYWQREKNLLKERKKPTDKEW